MSTIIEERQFFAVRCCCQPTKVIGFLLLPKVGGDVRTIEDVRGVKHRAEIRTICQNVTPAPQYTQYGVPIGYVPDASPVMTSEQAIYSEDRGEEFWLTIPGFIRIVTPEFICALLEPTCPK